MAYEPVLPPDTANEITEFIRNRYVGQASEMAAADAIEREIQKITANPALGVPGYGGPFESRRIYQFNVQVGDSIRTVELVYRVTTRPSVVFSGFREVLATPL